MKCKWIPKLQIVAFIIFQIMFSVFSKAQDLTTLADSAFARGEYKTAISYFKQLIKNDAKNKKINNESLGKFNWYMGKCYYQLYSIDSAIYFYKHALPFYRETNLWNEVGQIHIDINSAFREARTNKLKWTPPAIKDEILKEVYFRISEVKYFDKDSIQIVVNAGTYDGVIKDIYAKCLGALKKDKKTDRTGWILANATVASVAPNRSILKARLYNSEDSLHRVYVNDIAAMYCKYNQNKSADLMQQLSALNICFADNYKTQFYDWREFMDADSLYELDILEKMCYDIKEIYEVVKDDKSYDTMKCEDGLFKGMSMLEALNKTAVIDVRAFLQFVKAYPGKYAGMDFKFAETYATWVINKCPASANAMVDYYIHQTNKTKRIDYIENYSTEIYKENYFDAWKNEILKSIRTLSMQDINLKLEMLKDAGYLFKNDNFKSWYFFCDGKYFQKMKDTTSAKSNFKKALAGFEQNKNTEGIYLCNEALNQKSANAKIDIVLQNGHSAYFSMNFSPDGKYFVTGSDDKSIKLWDARLGKEIITVVAHDDIITSVCFSYDGRYILSTSYDKTVKLWDSDNLKLISTFNTGISNSKAILTRNSEYFIVCGRDSVMQMWSIVENKMIKRFSRHKRKVFDICWGDSEKEFYSCGADSFIYKWDINDNKMLRWYKEKDRITGVKISPDGRWMANTLANGKIDVWDLNTNKSIYFFNNLKSYINDSSGSFYLCEPTFSNDSRYLIYGARNSKFSIMELVSGNYITYNTTHVMDLMQIVMSSDGSFFATVARDFKINLFDFQNYLFDAKYSLRKITIAGHSDAGGIVAFDKASSLFINGTKLRKYDLISGKSETVFNYINAGVGIKIVYDNERRNMVYVDYSYKSVVRCNFEDKTFDTLFTNSGTKIKEMDYNFTTGMLILYTAEDRLLKILNDKTIEDIKALVPDSFNRGLFIHKTTGNIFLSTYTEIFIYDSSLKLINKIQNFNDTNLSIFQSISGNYLIRFGFKNTVDLILLKDYKTTQSLMNVTGEENQIFSACMSPDDSLLMVGLDNGELQIWDWQNNRQIKKFKDHSMFVMSISVSANGKYLATSSLDAKVMLYNLKTKESLCTLYAMYERGILTITDSNFYLAPRNCYDGFVFKLNKQIYTPEQFDLQFHRPDLVVKKIGEADADMINAYHAAYVKRAKRNGLDTSNNILNVHLPLVEIENKESLPITTSQNNIQLKVKASDIQYAIKAIRVWVNNIPLYDVNGLQFKPVAELETNIDISLQSGRNSIKVAAVNDKGSESLKEFYEIVCNYSDTSKKSKVYLVVISVSKYKDANYNLTYAAKDGRDLIDNFKAQFPSLSVDSFINENVLKENILNIKSKLMKTTVNDKVIIFVSGHGLLDEKLNFYFATHDIDFKHPEIRGIAYEQINALLDGIPARQKLLLMDACHSGEIDKDVKPQTQTNNKNTDEVKQEYTKRGSQLLDESKVGLQNSFELMQDLFSDLSYGNGAVVIGAASGTGYALESPTWRNGVFTYCIINGLKNRKADLDRDGTIKVSELSEYISREVQILTKGNQKPTSRAENLEYDWGIW